MKSVLGLIGSPRRAGNCELLVKEIASRVPGGARLSMVRLVDKDIRPCKACYRCLTGDCPHEDDFRAVMDAILAADGIVVAAPSYLHGTHHSIQRFLDRGLQFWKHFDRLFGKPAVALATAGIRDGEGFALLGVENLVRAMGMTLKGRAVVHAALPGEAFLSDEGPAVAQRLADALFAPGAERPEGPSCAQCGGTYFELRGGNGVYCLSCGGVGTASTEGGGLRVDIAPPAHPWLGPAARRAHGEWLIGMKEKFLRERERLKAVAARHKGGDFL